MCSNYVSQSHSLPREKYTISLQVAMSPPLPNKNEARYKFWSLCINRWHKKMRYMFINIQLTINTKQEDRQETANRQHHRCNAEIATQWHSRSNVHVTAADKGAPAIDANWAEFSSDVCMSGWGTSTYGRCWWCCRRGAAPGCSVVTPYRTNDQFFNVAVTQNTKRWTFRKIVPSPNQNTRCFRLD